MIQKLKQAKESVAYEYDGNLITRVCNFYPNQKVPVLRYGFIDNIGLHPIKISGWKWIKRYLSRKLKF